jgi:uncharacterized protein (TIGR01627 family)
MKNRSIHGSVPTSNHGGTVLRSAPSSLHRPLHNSLDHRKWRSKNIAMSNIVLLFALTLLSMISFYMLMRMERKQDSPRDIVPPGKFRFSPDRIRAMTESVRVGFMESKEETSFLGGFLNFGKSSSSSSSASVVTKRSVSSSSKELFLPQVVIQTAERTLTFRRYQDAAKGKRTLDLVPFPTRSIDDTSDLLSLIDASENKNETTYGTILEKAQAMKQVAFATLSADSAAGDRAVTLVDAPLQCMHHNVPEIASEKPIMAIITSTQSTKNHTQPQDSLLFKHMIRSVINTISEVEQQRWSVHIYVAVDHTDAWWIQFWPRLAPHIPSWLQATMCLYPDRKHHIPFNEIALTAYQEEADYFCRVNDDTEFRTPQWVTLAVSTLQAYDPPNIGVVGPSCHQGNTAIMTHDLVHRSHLEIFHGYYYPPVFNNWYLDDWISSVYSSSILGSAYSRTTVLAKWSIKHWMYETRYIPDTTDAQWLPVEYERGRRLIQNYIYQNFPQHNITAQRQIAKSLPTPTRLDQNVIDAIQKVLPPNGNLLIWGLNMDSQYWHRVTTGKVYFLEDKSIRRKFQRKGIWRDFIYKSFPYLQIFPIGYTTKRNDMQSNYDTFIYGQTLDSNLNWCDLEVPVFPDAVRQTVWDVIVVDAPELCSTFEMCGTVDSPSAVQALYMTKVLVANQTSRFAQSNNSSGVALQEQRRLTHVFVDDFQRSLERDFSQQLFMKGPSKVLNHTVPDKLNQTIAHFVFDESDRVAQNITLCDPPLVRDTDYFPASSDIDVRVALAILSALPPDGNMLVWGIGPDSIFWHRATRGRVVFLLDKYKLPMTDKANNGTSYFDYYKSKHPELEIHQVVFSTENNEKFKNQFYKKPELWPSLEMKESAHQFPTFLHDIAWNVILVDDPLGCCDAGPGRLQSLYMTRVLAYSSVQLQANVTFSLEDPVTHVFVHDYERTLENEFSQQFFNKMPKTIHRRKALQCGQFVVDESDFTRKPLAVFDKPTATSKYASNQKRNPFRERSAMPRDMQMGWEQVRTVLSALPEDGNLLVWGLGNDSPFWNRTTTGKVMFLEDGSWDTNLINGKRWFDQITTAHPFLEAYVVDYTTKNDEANFERFMNNPDKWEKELEIKGFPKKVMDTRWDVILVDAPMGYPGAGPARFQSLYMTLLLARKYENISPIVHVFVDDYERKVEREFSQLVFERAPMEIIGRRRTSAVPANEQAHFVFGAMKRNQYLKTSRLVPWKDPTEKTKEALPIGSWIVLVEVNDGYYDFFLNWLYHFEQLQIGLDVVVFAEDDAVYKKLEVDVQSTRQYLQIERSGSSFLSKSLDYNSKQYKELVSARATHILSKLIEGRNVIYTDVDTVWKGNPLPYLVWAGDTTDAVLEVDTAKFEGMSPYYCTGFMAFVSNERTIHLMEYWKKALQKAQLNQPIFNALLQKRSTVLHQPLPNVEFPSGQMFFSTMDNEQRSQSIVVHNNYIQGAKNKQIRFDKYGLWKVNTTAPPLGSASKSTGFLGKAMGFFITR